MTIVSAYKCNIGQVRKQNEDYVWVDEQAGLFIVADGMGGHEAGDVASKMTTDTVGPLFLEQLKAHNKTLSSDKIQALMVNAIEMANEHVIEAAQKATQKRKMGSTIVMAFIQSSTAYISHAGDSRAYLAQGSSLIQLTEDDSWQTFGNTERSKENSRTKIDHMLTKSIGQNSKVEPSFRELKLSSGDCLLLCSDGLWDMVSDEQIAAELKRAGNNPDQAAEALVDAANAAGGKDNISVVVIKTL